MTIENLNNCCGDCSQCECNGVHVQTNYPSKKHTKIIQSWLNGVPIQVKSDDGSWVDIENPSFFEHYDYRVKPKVTKKKFGIVLKNGCVVVSSSFVNCEFVFEDGNLIDAKTIPFQELDNDEEKETIFFKSKNKPIFKEFPYPKFHDYFL